MHLHSQQRSRQRCCSPPSQHCTPTPTPPPNFPFANTASPFTFLFRKVAWFLFLLFGCAELDWVLSCCFNPTRLVALVQLPVKHLFVSFSPPHSLVCACVRVCLFVWGKGGCVVVEVSASFPPSHKHKHTNTLTQIQTHRHTLTDTFSLSLTLSLSLSTSPPPSPHIFLLLHFGRNCRLCGRAGCLAQAERSATREQGARVGFGFQRLHASLGCFPACL